MTTSPYSLYRNTYPDPFLDIASTRLPKSHKKLLELYWYFATQHGQIAPIIKKLAKYPITHLVVNTKTNQEELNNKWLQCFEEDLNIYEKLEEFGLTYMGYGTVFALVHKPFIRFYRCNKCKTQVPAESQNKPFKVFFRDKKVYAHCDKCKREYDFTAVDEPLTNIEAGVSIVLLNPQHVTIKPIPMTDRRIFYYSVPTELQNAVKGSKPDYEIINNTPWIYIEAALQGKKIKFNNNEIFYTKEPTIPGPFKDWGVPIIFAALKDAYLHQVYKKADETFANERTVPARFVFPQSTNNDPLRTISLNKWARFMGDTLTKWRHDKNAVMPVPFPVGVATLGGETVQMNTVPLRDHVMKEIIGATGVPEGFLGDSMSWSGGSIQLRMLENAMIGYLRAIDKFLKFISDKIRTITKWEKVDIKLKPFAKADDIQKQQQYIQLAQLEKISWKEVLELFDLDPEKEFQKIMQEKERDAILKTKSAMAEARAVLESALVQVETQSRSQDYTQLRTNYMTDQTATQNKLTDPNKAPLDQHEEQSDAEAEEAQAEANRDPIADAKTDLLNAQADRERSKTDYYNAKGTAPAAIIDKLLQLPQDKQDLELEKLKKKAPRTADDVQRIMADMASEDVNQARDVLNDLRNVAGSPDALATRIMMLKPEMRRAVFEILSKEDPQLGLLVAKKLKTSPDQSDSMSSSNTDMRQLPDQKPPRRK